MKTGLFIFFFWSGVQIYYSINRKETENLWCNATFSSKKNSRLPDSFFVFAFLFFGNHGNLHYIYLKFRDQTSKIIDRLWKILQLFWNITRRQMTLHDRVLPHVVWPDHKYIHVSYLLKESNRVPMVMISINWMKRVIVNRNVALNKWCKVNRTHHLNNPIEIYIDSYCRVIRVNLLSMVQRVSIRNKTVNLMLSSIELRL